MNKYTILIIVVSIIIIFGCAYFKTSREGLTNNDTIVLIGDSVLNNEKYVGANNSVLDVLKTKLTNVNGFAKNGATIPECYYQLDEVPSEMNKSNTHIFISAGGNDILNSRGQLDSTAITSLFDKYMVFIKSVKTKLPNAHITVLNMYLPSNSRYQTYKNSVDQWNQLLKDNTNKDGLMYNIIDLNAMLNTPNDFVYEIEPSEEASQKIASAIYVTR